MGELRKRPLCAARQASIERGARSARSLLFYAQERNETSSLEAFRRARRSSARPVAWRWRGSRLSPDRESSKSMFFASDNGAGASPKIVNALVSAMTSGPAMAYGHDDLTRRAERRIG